MRAVIQRVNSGSVAVDDKIVGSINKGFVVLLGVSEKDTEADVLYMVDKTVNMRIFEDDNEKMNLSLLDIKGELLVVSQFTLYGDCRKGRRPNFMSAARPEKAEELYNEFVRKCRELGVKTETGTFQAYMKVNIENDGPVTVIVDSEKII
ncbi:MAG TPA: D-aminoacyl-tRNA deacylase [Bacillota bacterium]|jgi:D-tyrosyl-tRNA(Tyr) deacylase|nr:D-aminoacyl-tRNA deacylase [Bacillota bacterium]HRS21770.1 D-aminoacyl-tRNA deacylase [Clostridia bacterium]HRU41382.1 D-aminoacyl-tRNA deacylase [Candidatus Diapherotrites archaeon]HQE67555.1 D-aminoacyl-tRNA deacylase [Bacillota bacterium]HQI16411.1 D-aminoacyl-tRNA deacylase [Bacillota bacterium]